MRSSKPIELDNKTEIKDQEKVKPKQKNKTESNRIE